jgi:hypothetical protein
MVWDPESQALNPTFYPTLTAPRRGGSLKTLYPLPYSLFPTIPYTLYPIPYYTLYPVPYSLLYPIPYTLFPTIPYTRYPELKTRILEP